MESPLQEDWEALIELLSHAFKLLGGNQIEPSRQTLLEFSNTAAMLGMQDLASVSTKFQEFLVNKVQPEANEEAIGTLNFAIGALIEKMQTQQYGPAFVFGLGEVLLYLDFYGEEPDILSESPATEAVSPVPHGLSEETTATESRKEDPAASKEGDIEIGPAPSDEKEFHDLVQLMQTAEISEQSTDVSQPLTGDMKSEVFVTRGEDLTTSENDIVQDTAFEEGLAPQIPAEAESPPTRVDESSLSDGGVIDRYRMLLEIDPASQVFVALAEELSNRGLWKDAAETCRRGLVFHPRHLRAKALLGCSLWALGEMEEAESILLEARSDLEKNAILYKALAEIAESRGEPDRAQHMQRVYEILQMADGNTLSFAHELVDAGTETESQTAPPGSPSIAFLSALMERFEKKPEDRPMKEYKLFEVEDREGLKRILTKGS